ncbi:hypothetical protein BOTBODRAFT_51008 [Botryobasidium botryosum FD-172 SS1]|uniref:NmrA-like domain-containing protein n=1 Tax=Botryobasidium botryosum (strain FD-172 SS1) TaxID=930990 RepID=A0A067N201_BOTB1|nr:hypothetical protein BOTBODRAFT_51008 [Botryobasidium botryosum FD-172 SS1]
MSETPRVILVAGATGVQGRSFIEALKPEGSAPPAFRVLALTRQPDSQSAKDLASSNQHVQVVQGDLDKPETIRKVFVDAGGEGAIYGVFCVLAFPGLGKDAEGEEKQGKSLADIALEYKVQHYIFSSYERGGTSMDHVLKLDRKAKFDIENYVMALGDKGLPWTIIRPTFFMENFLGSIGRVTATVLRVGLKEDTKVNLVAAKDIGSVAAAVFQNPEKTKGRAMSITSDHVTTAEIEASYKRGTGKDIPSVPNFVGRALLAINAHARGVTEDIERVHEMISNPTDDTYRLSQELTDDIHPQKTTFEQWSRDLVEKGKRDEAETPKKGWNGVSLLHLLQGKL